MNEIFGQGSVRRVRNQLLITGDQETRRRIREIVFLADSPFPLVQLDLFPIQISGGQKEVQMAIEEITNIFRTTQENLRKAQALVTNTMAIDQGKNLNDEKQRKRILDKLNCLGFRHSDGNVRHLNLVEAFVYLLVADDEHRKRLITAFNQRLLEWSQKPECETCKTLEKSEKSEKCETCEKNGKCENCEKCERVQMQRGAVPVGGSDRAV